MSLFRSLCGDYDLFWTSLIYILNLDAGEWSCFVFRLGWMAGRSALTIPTCDQLPIWHRLKPALSWPVVSDDCLSQVIEYMPASSLCLTSVPSPACHWASQQPVAKPALTSLHTRSPGYGARVCPYEPTHEITWDTEFEPALTSLRTRSPGHGASFPFPE